MSEPDTVYCMKCAHHFITYDTDFPYGCRAMNFKSKRLPQYEVAGASQQTCQFFRSRPGLPRSQRSGPAGD